MGAFLFNQLIQMYFSVEKRGIYLRGCLLYIFTSYVQQMNYPVLLTVQWDYRGVI